MKHINTKNVCVLLSLIENSHIMHITVTEVTYNLRKTYIHLSCMQTRIINLFPFTRRRNLLKWNKIILSIEKISETSTSSKRCWKKKVLLISKDIKKHHWKLYTQMTNAIYNLELSSFLPTVHKYSSEKASLKDTLSTLSHYNHLCWIIPSQSFRHTEPEQTSFFG